MDELYILMFISFLTCICSTYINFDFMARLHRSIYKNKWVYIITFIIYTMCITAVNLRAYPIGKTIVMIILNTIIGHFLFNEDKVYIVFYMVFAVCIGICEMISIPVFQYVFSWTGYFEYKNSWFISVMLVLGQVIVLFMYRAFLELFSNRRIKSFSKVQVFNFIIIPIFSFINILIMLSITQYIMYPAIMIMVVINMIFVLTLNFYLTYLFQTISYNNELKKEIALYNQKSQLEYSYYNNIDKKYEELRKLIHDIKNHIYTMQKLYDTEENDKAQKYGKDLINIMDSFKQDYYSSNKILNIVLNDKFKIAEELGIDVKCMMNDVYIDFMEDIDITTIFANLLDNAIEGARKCSDKALISIKADNLQEFIVLTISNSCISSEVLRRKGKFLSTKKNHNGLGLENIRKTIEKYDGHIRCELIENRFKTTLFIPINDK